jgi:hypothetical protein
MNGGVRESAPAQPQACRHSYRLAAFLRLSGWKSVAIYCGMLCVVFVEAQLTSSA